MKIALRESLDLLRSFYVYRDLWHILCQKVGISVSGSPEELVRACAYNALSHSGMILNTQQVYTYIRGSVLCIPFITMSIKKKDNDKFIYQRLDDHLQRFTPTLSKYKIRLLVSWLNAYPIRLIQKRCSMLTLADSVPVDDYFDAETLRWFEKIVHINRSKLRILCYVLHRMSDHLPCDETWDVDPESLHLCMQIFLGSR